MVQAVRFYEVGGPEVLRLEDVEVGEPGAGEVRIRVDAIGLNRAEVMFRGGYYISEIKNFPAKLGYEAAGVIEAVGDGVTDFDIGQPISVVPAFSMESYVVYAESAIVPAAAVVARPDNIDAVTGAAVWMAYATVYGALVDIGRMRAGDAVLITAASSSVGVAAIQLVNRLGGIPIATTRTQAKKERLLAAGAAEVIVTNDEDLVKRVGELTDGRGVQFVFDPIGGPGLVDLARVTAQGGTLFLYGMLDRRPTPYPGMEVNRFLTMRNYTLHEITTDPERLRRAVQFINSGLKSGAFAPVIAKTFPLAEIAEAHRYMEANDQFGKIIVTTS